MELMKTRTYKAWINMKQRCYNPNQDGYHNYGGRGITVCDSWRLSFENFNRDMGDVPDGMILDRKDNNGNYQPDNCEWTTRRWSNINKRRGVPWDNHWRGNQWMKREELI
jgi:hypothetical protein